MQFLTCFSAELELPWAITAFSDRSQRSCSFRAGSPRSRLRWPAGSPSAGFLCPCSPYTGHPRCTCSESGSRSAVFRTGRNSELQKICLAYSFSLPNNYLHFDPVYYKAGDRPRPRAYIRSCSRRNIRRCRSRCRAS